jgi:hypothetical protein
LLKQDGADRILIENEVWWFGLEKWCLTTLINQDAKKTLTKEVMTIQSRISSKSELKKLVISSLKKQGFKVREGHIITPKNPTKESYRKLHKLAVEKKLSTAEPYIRTHENRLIKYIANGDEIDVHKISPKIVLVKPNTEDALLFRYAYLHWSIPVSAGYGRRLRFLVFDRSNNKLIGLFGLGDPVFSLKARDNWIDWDIEMKKERLFHVMDSYVLGAIPPYNQLLCGKLVAMLALSNEVRKVFYKKYLNHVSLIKKKKRVPYLVMLTTTSALGRSSLYNRISVKGFKFWNNVGFTQGSGEFHFSNGIYENLRSFAERYCEPTAKQSIWGTGYRNKREVVKKCLQKIGLNTDLLYHGIKREIVAAPLGKNALRFLRGETSRPSFYDWKADYLANEFLNRWLFSRAMRDSSYLEFEREQYRLWK